MMQSHPDAVIVTVCKAGGDFRPTHAIDLAAQLLHQNPRLDLLPVTFTDHKHWLSGSGPENQPTLTLPLEQGLPGWWSVLEAFRAPQALYEIGYRLPPSARYVYVDLDTVCVGSIEPLLVELDRALHDRLACLPDIYRPERPEMGVMSWTSPYVPGEIRRRFDRSVGNREIDPKAEPDNSPSAWLRSACEPLLVQFDRWQAGVWSYKHDLRDADKWASRIPRTPPVKPGLVVFHGKPRPWHIGGAEGVRNMIRQEALTDGA